MASWGTTVWEQRLPCCVSFRSFFEELKNVFDHAASGRIAARLLAELRQGDRTITDYQNSIEFCKDEIYLLDLLTGEDKFIDLAIHVDTRLQQQGQRTPRGLLVSQIFIYP